MTDHTRGNVPGRGAPLSGRGVRKQGAGDLGACPTCPSFTLDGGSRFTSLSPSDPRPSMSNSWPAGHMPRGVWPTGGREFDMLVLDRL